MATFCRTILKNSTFLKRIKNPESASLYIRSCHSFLNSNFSCDEVWKERLTKPVLKDVVTERFAILLQDKLDKEANSSPLDIDILANKIHEVDRAQLDYVTNILAKFRASPNAPIAFSSTSYATIRSFLEFDETDKLIEILKDKTKYGIFLDGYSAAMCLNHFISKKLFKEAANVAFELMLQEDFGSPITKVLASYSSFLYWKNFKEPEIIEIESSNNDDEEEEIWMKVKYIKNPWYDDHFDIKDEKLLLGKTLCALAEDNNSKSYSHQFKIIGLGLHQKINDGLLLLENSLPDSNFKIDENVIQSFQTSVENLPTKEHPEEAKDPGLVTLEDVKPYTTSSQKSDFLARFNNIKEKLNSENRIVEIDIEKSILDHIQQTISEFELSDISKHTEILKTWNEQRQEYLDYEIKKEAEEKLKIEIAEKLRLLTETEEQLSYFEAEEKINLGISLAPEEVTLNIETEEEQFVAAPGERGGKKAS